ncbi:hypothetical protein HYT59_02490 [Candidatus Woesebacteria bacterium]|nr:hypothetical protein [Candidatus Woesebacteria bacterium]
MTKAFCGISAAVLMFFVLASNAQAQTITPSPTKAPVLRATPSPTLSPTPSPTATPEPRADLTEKTPAVVEPLRKILDEQNLGAIAVNPIKYAIRASVGAGVPVNTIVLLLLLPGIGALIAAARHLVGLRGFGILMPAALSVVFLALGPVVGIGLFLVIVVTSVIVRFGLRKTKVRLGYLPRMALIMLFVVLGVLGVLFAAPILRHPDIINVSIFPVLFLVILAEDFTRVQLGKSVRVAVNITTETLILALVSYILLTLKALQEFVLLNPEGYLLGLIVFDFLIGRYVGLRFMEFWRFRKLISS